MIFLKKTILYIGQHPLPVVLRRIGHELYQRKIGTQLLPWMPHTWKHWLRRHLRGDAATGPVHLITRRTAAKVSIIIPVYNHAAHLSRCLESALSQDYSDVEVVVVDDASPDPEVRNVLNSFSSRPNLVQLQNVQNEGIAATQNKALIASTGDIIAFLDCDDYLTPDAVTTSLKYWNEDTVYSHSARINIDENDREVSRISFVHLPRKDYFAENLQSMYATHFKMIRRDAFAKTGLFDTRFDSAQDYDMLMRIAFHYPSSAFIHVPEFLYYHRFHAQQTSEIREQQQQRNTEIIRHEALLRLNISQGKFDTFLSIIMLSFGKQEQTLQAIKSLEDTVKIPHEIILLDNGSDPNTIEFIQQHIDGHFPTVNVAYHPVNLGPAAGRREALKWAKGPYYLFFDNDEIAEPGWLEELLVRAESDPDIAMVCCKVIFPNHHLQFSGGYMNHCENNLVELKLYDYNRNTYELETAQFRDCDWCPVGATLFTVDPSPFLHAGYPNVFEDAGVSMALARLGKRLVNSPASWVWHEHVTFKENVSMKKRYLQERYDKSNMLVSVATFYKENGLIIKDDYVWRENRLEGMNLADLKQLLEKVGTRHGI